jgi:hypothetical protein
MSNTQIITEIVSRFRTDTAGNIVVGSRTLINNYAALPPMDCLRIMTRHLYNYCYTVGNLTQLGSTNPNKDQFSADASDFLKKLQNANKSDDANDYGWSKWIAEGQDRYVVRKNGFYKLIEQSELRQEVFSGPLYSIPRLKEHIPDNAYFYYVFGDTQEEWEPTCSVRYYWNYEPAAIPGLIELLTSELNRYSIPFQFKCLIDPSLYAHRADTAVLYVSARFANFCFNLLEMLNKENTFRGQADTPLFTVPIFPGISFAENPPDNESFGISRSKLLAGGILESIRLGYGSGDLQTTLKYLHHFGHNPEQLHLNPGSFYPYTFLN